MLRHRLAVKNQSEYPAFSGVVFPRPIVNIRLGQLFESDLLRCEPATPGGLDLKLREGFLEGLCYLERNPAGCGGRIPANARALPSYGMFC